MRIISKFNDYYDGLSERGKGDRFTKVWIRKEKTASLHADILERFVYRSIHFWGGLSDRWEQGFLIVAGKVYPFIKFYKTRWAVKDEPREFFFDFETLLKEKPHINKSYVKREMRDFFKEYPDMTDVCIELKSPILLIEPNSYYFRHDDYNTFNLKVDASLKKLSFSKVKSSYDVYQEIDYFFSNVLVEDQMPKHNQTDENKIVSHGFDLKQSFRKRKGE